MGPELQAVVLLAALVMSGCGGSDANVDEPSAAADTQTSTADAGAADGPNMHALGVATPVKPVAVGITTQKFPVTHQLYPRASIGDTSVQISFSVTSSSATVTSLTLTSTVAKAATSSSTVLISQGQTITMKAVVPVALSATAFTLTANSAGGSSALVAEADDVVAGDLYVVEGQSNALSIMHPEQDKWVAKMLDSPWIRTVGGTWEATAQSDAYHAWYVASGGGVLNSSGVIGKWPLRMARDLVDKQQVPIAILNGARGNQQIAYFLPNYVQANDAGNNYQRLLSRLRAYDLTASVRALFYYQGESDGTSDTEDDPPDPAAWTPGFNTLLKAWKASFPNLTHVYLTQIRGCDTSAATNSVRDQQRQFASGSNSTAVPLVQVMSTSAMGGFDGCHFLYTGYAQLGDWYARLLLRDFYGVSMANATAPTPTQIRSNSDGTQVFITLANHDPISVGAASNADFFVTTAKGVVRHPTSVSAASTSGVITLTLPAGGPVVSVSYRGTRNKGGPWITNGAGIGLLAFEAMPVGP